jgi:hypothetical protein
MGCPSTKQPGHAQTRSVRGVVARTNWVVFHHAHGTGYSLPAEGVEEAGHRHGEESYGNDAGFCYRQSQSRYSARE